MSSLDMRTLPSVTAGTLVPRMVPVHSKHSVNMYNVRMDGWMNGFKWFQGFLGFCGEEKSELSIPGRRAWSRIQEGNGTPCTQSPSAGLTPSPADPSLGGIWARGLSSLDLPAVPSPRSWCRCSLRGQSCHLTSSVPAPGWRLAGWAQAPAFTAR